MIPPGFAALLLPRVRGGGEDGPVTQLAGADADALLSGLTVGRPGRLLHVHRVPPRAAEPTDWPAWVHPVLISSLTRMGVVAPWSHQAAAASLAAAGQHVVLATGTASGKSLAYLLPVLTAALEGTNAPNGRGATTLYLSPTKALAHDQLRAITNLELPGVRAATYDGDTASEPGFASMPTSYCPTPTCCTARCCPATARGPRSSEHFTMLSLTNATPIAESLAPTWRM
jgi:hypothetical protein